MRFVLVGGWIHGRVVVAHPEGMVDVGNRLAISRVDPGDLTVGLTRGVDGMHCGYNHWSYPELTAG